MPRLARLDVPGVLDQTMIRGIDPRKIFRNDSGFAFNHFYERWRGQSLGEDIYDWLHRRKWDDACL